MSVARCDERWRFTNARLIERIGTLSPQELGLRAAPRLWPIWAIAAHAAVVRVYWLCNVCKEPGTDRTPFTDAANEGWEDHLDHPRGAVGLRSALEAARSLVAGSLDRWAPGMVLDRFQRAPDGRDPLPTRQPVLIRLLTPD